MSTDSGTEAVARSRALLAILGVTALALLARLADLGGRIFHWDEGRVGYWILRYHETGEFSYRPIIHGPFLPVVNDYLFAVLPATDFTARLPVALVGGLLPLSVWLFREHLRRDELVALAFFLAANPLLVYYSRFMRNDVLVAAFSFAALGFVVRAYDTGRLAYLIPAGASFATGAATKENYVVYLACFLGAAFLVFDHRLLARTSAGESARDILFSELPASIRERLRARGAGSLGYGAVRYAAGVLGGLLAFLAVFVFFYAPRPDLWNALGGSASMLPVLEAGSVGAVSEMVGSWLGGGHQSHEYLPYLKDFLETFVYGAPVLIVFALVGIVVDRYGVVAGRIRWLVAFATYWGVVCIFGYPLATDIQAPWVVVHAVVPLAIPAAVGAAFVFRSGVQALDAKDTVGVGLAALVLVASVGGVAAANVDYWNASTDEDSEVLQWAQPANDLQATLDDVERVSAANSGTDVLLYGTHPPDSDETHFYVENESAPLDGPSWHSRLPLPWYFESAGVERTSSAPDANVSEVTADAPPVVIVYEWDRAELESELDGYVARQHAFKLWSEDVVVFIDEDALDAANETRG
ncbi:TIGR03663 family protein [Haloferax volcanii]|uniref:TIGR03663 family protein n=3 Tax=Haloferax volcanii TaxID=2246 RepID=A0A6C0UPT4_HALVO|nr:MULTISPECIES: flippase activity-associated protein Agl23 [Haloferax]ELK55327.1 dolichyl-phosphate-mannose-proteinmannosyltransfe rase [Haloferax sp. BAB-2207]ELZ73504.1 dolichyl-phosphate-mannose-proteinmannosyltransfe rase [Haloferax lucentense DSM 14919]ELZ92165.1 dolichyl-phosphate-mannose-proteinmannosyltransfe rase [Haloferax alexandrinus JCM 10717]NLV01902.1 TIGR03663 family protein [Haloferax alexandrinus]QIB77505.1 TIGR03663 family protein [Haloferax alexandrinus]